MNGRTCVWWSLIADLIDELQPSLGGNILARSSLL